MIVPCRSCDSKVRVPESRLGESARCPRCKGAIAPLDRPVAVTSEADFDALVRDSKLPVLVDFWAPWCGPCRSLAPELEKLAQARTAKLVVAKVDTDELQRLGARFGIQSIPTMVLFRGGREASRVSGAMKADALARQLGV